MTKNTAYLLEVNDAGLWTGLEAYRNEKDADAAWRTKTIESIREEKGDEAPDDIDDLSDGDLSTLAEGCSPHETGFYSLEKIDFYE